jgi:cytochrome bd-type quinol oxidase subunit 2
VRWVQRLPDFGRIGVVCAVVYLVAGWSFDGVDDGVAATGLDRSRLLDAWEATWALRGFVALLVVGFVAQRIWRASAGRRGLTPAGWRGFAATSSILGLGLSLVPTAAAIVLTYGVLVLEPAGRIDQQEAIALGTGAAIMSGVALVGLFFAIRATIHLVRALVGNLVWRGG